LVAIDEVGALAIGLPALRQLLLDALPDDARVILAGRMPPDRSWLADSLDGLVIDVALGPMAEVEARELLLRRGVTDPQRQAVALRWAEGFPLALALAAESGQADGEAAGNESAGGGLDARLIRHLAGAEIDGVDNDLLLVASLTWAVDARLIAAALPGRNTRADIPALVGLSLTQQVGNRVVLHSLLAQAVRTVMRSRDPARYGAVKVRIADHLAARARDGDQAALFELTELIDDPEIRRWVSRGSSSSRYADGLRDGDLDAAATAFGERGLQWIDRLRGVTGALPRFTTAVRREDGGLSALSVLVVGDDLDAADPISATILAHAHANGVDVAQALAGLGTALLDAGDSAEGTESVRVGLPAGIQRAGAAAARYNYIAEWEGTPAPTGLFSQLGFDRIECTIVLDGLPVRVWFRDFGPGGPVAFYHSIVRAENGEAPLVATEGIPLLAELQAARDAGGDELRQQLRQRLGALFGPDPNDRRLQAVLEASYLEGLGSEAALLQRLHLSRSTYYRQLRAARERVAAAELRPGARAELRAELRPERD
jgi:hypothetical protein